MESSRKKPGWRSARRIVRERCGSRIAAEIGVLFQRTTEGRAHLGERPVRHVQNLISKRPARLSDNPRCTSSGAEPGSTTRSGRRTRVWATAQGDSLNPRVFPDDPTYPYAVSSVLDTPGAPDEQWALRKPLRRGQIEEKKFTSTLLTNQRDIWIYTPPGYTRTAGPYPFVLLFDGAAYVADRFGNAPATLDNLINDGRIRPAIVCFLPAMNRGAEQGLAGADRYSDAIMQELLPVLRASYAITTNPADIVVGGFSNGGMSECRQHCLRCVTPRSSAMCFPSLEAFADAERAPTNRIRSPICIYARREHLFASISRPGFTTTRRMPACLSMK